jgi:hypothetical protein
MVFALLVDAPIPMGLVFGAGLGVLVGILAGQTSAAAR